MKNAPTSFPAYKHTGHREIKFVTKVQTTPGKIPVEIHVNRNLQRVTYSDDTTISATIDIDGVGFDPATGVVTEDEWDIIALIVPESTEETWIASFPIYMAASSYGSGAVNSLEEGRLGMIVTGKHQ